MLGRGCPAQLNWRYPGFSTLLPKVSCWPVSARPAGGRVRTRVSWLLHRYLQCEIRRLFERQRMAFPSCVFQGSVISQCYTG